MINYSQEERESIVSFYVSQGFSLIPLRGKIPIERNWQNTKYNPDLTLWQLGNGNFGVVLRDCDLVIDVDPRNFKNGTNSLKKLMLTTGIEYFDTFKVLTGGGGLHIYMKKPPMTQIQTKLPLLPGVEFKTKGAQVVGATSLHPETKNTYDVLARRLYISEVESLLKNEN